MDDTTPSYEQLYIAHKRVLAEWYQESENLNNHLKKLRDENEQLRAVLAAISLYVSAGLGDEHTTAQQYLERIKDGIDRLTTDLQS